MRDCVTVGNPKTSGGGSQSHTLSAVLTQDNNPVLRSAATDKKPSTRPALLRVDSFQAAGPSVAFANPVIASTASNADRAA